VDLFTHSPTQLHGDRANFVECGKFSLQSEEHKRSVSKKYYLENILVQKILSIFKVELIALRETL
jgi:hypothetical protein